MALLVSLSGCGGGEIPAATPSTTFSLQTARIQSMMGEKIASTGIPGVIVSVRTNDGEWMGASGLANVATGEPMTPGLSFRIGSVTKVFTAAMILRLVDKGVLNVDDTLEKWLPELNIPNANIITIHMLLNHTSGLPEYCADDNIDGFWKPVYQDKLRNWTPEELWNLAKNSEAPKTPGSEFRYVNTNYVLLGMIAEKATGMTAGRIMDAEFFKPLGMNHSFLAEDEKIPAPASRGYAWNPEGNEVEDIVYNPSIAWTAGSMVSNENDLLTWVDALFVRKTVLKPETLDIMLAVAVPSTYYGYGIISTRTKYGIFVSHDGEIMGFLNSINYFPDQGIIVNIFVNRADMYPTAIQVDSHYVLGAIRSEIMKILLPDIE